MFIGQVLSSALDKIFLITSSLQKSNINLLKQSVELKGSYHL